MLGRFAVRRIDDELVYGFRGHRSAVTIARPSSSRGPDRRSLLLPHVCVRPEQTATTPCRDRIQSNPDRFRLSDYELVLPSLRLHPPGEKTLAEDTGCG